MNKRRERKNREETIMKRSDRVQWFGVLIGLPVCAMSSEALAQTWPLKPVRIVIPFTAGGGSDTVGRVLAQSLSTATGQNFIIDNRPGAGGNIAFEYVAKADADGYTLINSPIGIATNPSMYRSINFRFEDFAAVTYVGEAPLLVVCNVTLPVRSLADLIRLAKARPGEINYASPGTGSSAHLASETLKLMAGIDIVHVPYKGGPQAVHDVIGGQVAMTTLPLPETLPQVRAGRLRALGQTGAKRSAAVPDIPTLDEQGLKGYNVVTWYVILAPARTPAALINRIHAEFEAALKLPEVQERLKAAGVADIVAGGPERATQFIRAEHARWSKLIQAAGIKAD